MNRKNEEDFFLFSWKKFLLSRIYNGETFDNKVYNDPSRREMEIEENILMEKNSLTERLAHPTELTPEPLAA